MILVMKCITSDGANTDAPPTEKAKQQKAWACPKLKWRESVCVYINEYVSASYYCV